MMYNWSFYSNPLEERHIPTNEEMEQERLRVIEWEEHKKEQFYQKLSKEEMKDKTEVR